MKHNNQGLVSSGYEAGGMLKAEGFQVAQVKYGPFNLIAWKSLSEIIFIQTLATRCLSGKIVDKSVFQSLMEYAKSEKILGEIQLWVRSRSGWTRYRICPHGIYPIREVRR